jgi:ribonuclease P protein component
MNHSLAQGVRITDARDYAHIFQQGNHSQGKFWKLIACPSDQENPRLGLAISKKICKRAVDRNLFKRIARETFRQYRHDFDLLDFVVMIKKIPNTNNQELVSDLLSLLQKTKQGFKS